MERRPSSVAIIGCAGGNGFEQLERAGVRRIVGVDINPDYIAATARRCINRFFPGLSRIQQTSRPRPFSSNRSALIYAALVLEYVELARAMASLRRHCKPGGMLATVVQLPHESVASSDTLSIHLADSSFLQVMKLITPRSAHGARRAGRFFNPNARRLSRQPAASGSPSRPLPDRQASSAR